MFKHTHLFFILTCIGFACDQAQPTPITPTGTTTTATTPPNPNADVNNWIYDTMKDWYLWEENMVAKTKTDLTKTADVYFDSILYKKDTVDRFSWIQEDVTELTNSLNGINKSYGYRFKLFTVANTDRVIVSVAYPITGSPAEKAGLKRGDIFTKINGTTITINNYRDLIYATPDTYTLTYGSYASGAVTDTEKTVKIVAEEVTENPIHFSKLITKGSKKIGYLVYNQFISTYDSQLRQAFGNLKTQGANEFILDLRYNGGGYISSAQVLASLICKNNSSNNVFAINQANSKKGVQYASQSRFLNEANNLGLNRLFVLTSTGTASASELVINSLRPFMEVILVGEHTYGKNVGSITISDTQKRWKWGMQPIVLKTANSLGESNYGTKDGFLPTYDLKDNRLPFLAFGDENETLLKKALEVITGATVAQARVAVSGNKQFDEILDSKQLESYKNGMFVESLK